MNQVFFWIVAVSLLAAALGFGEALVAGDPAAAAALPAAVGQGALDGAKGAVELAIGLVGYMSLFLGLMKVVEEAGGLAWMARLIRPLMIRLFPDVPPEHPAMGAIVMNLAANALGLGNAATPFGLKAMKELDALNPDKGTATNAMVRFLAINTSGVALLPTGVIGLRAQLGSADPAGILPTTLAATALSTTVAVLAAAAFSSLPAFAAPPAQAAADAALRATAPRPTARELLPVGLFGAGLVGMVVLVHQLGELASGWIVPLLIGGMLGVGRWRGVKVYEVFITGAREGFQMAISIIPYLVAILAAVGMVRKSGAMDALTGALGRVTAPLGLPAEALPLAMLRPLSGSGAYGLTAELVKTHGPDSYLGQLASTLNGSTETTFYVLAVYFGSVGVLRARHAIAAGLSADLAGVIGSVLAVRLLLG